MNDIADRMKNVEERLDSLTSTVTHLRGEVGELRGEVGELRGEVGELRGEFGGLRGEVHQLRILVERHDDQFRIFAEVQAQHGRQLEEHGRLLREIKDEMAPLKDLRDFVSRIATNHEGRITALEKSTGFDAP